MVRRLVDQIGCRCGIGFMVGETIRYRPNAEHPAFADFAEAVLETRRVEFFNCVALVGASLPVEYASCRHGRPRRKNLSDQWMMRRLPRP